MKESLLKNLSLHKGVKLTDLRKDVLNILYNNKTPMGAYEVLEELKQHREGAEPPTVYRVLKFLADAKLVHRIEANNTYVCCSHLLEESAEHKAILLLCKICEKIYEYTDSGILKAIMQFADRQGLEVDDSVIEMKGVCQNCV
jgi:Fur family zinc uptake transcriptional regulator